jgi:hypothetical protein
VLLKVDKKKKTIPHVRSSLERKCTKKIWKRTGRTGRTEGIANIVSEMAISCAECRTQRRLVVLQENREQGCYYRKRGGLEGNPVTSVDGARCPHEKAGQPDSSLTRHSAREMEAFFAYTATQAAPRPCTKQRRSSLCPLSPWHP